MEDSLRQLSSPDAGKRSPLWKRLIVLVVALAVPIGMTIGLTSDTAMTMTLEATGS